MTKTSSEQLCEIVGLPYEKKIYFKNPGIEEVLCKCTNLDFEQPENFVKLLELPLDTSENSIYKTLWSYLWWQDFETVSRISVLVFLIRKLGINTEINNQIKQSIRDFDDWVWG